jgi:hypothetical protein
MPDGVSMTVDTIIIMPPHALRALNTPLLVDDHDNGTNESEKCVWLRFWSTVLLTTLSFVFIIMSIDLLVRLICK